MKQYVYNVVVFMQSTSKSRWQSSSRIKNKYHSAHQENKKSCFLIVDSKLQSQDFTCKDSGSCGYCAL